MSQHWKTALPCLHVVMSAQICMSHTTKWITRSFQIHLDPILPHKWSHDIINRIWNVRLSHGFSIPSTERPDVCVSVCVCSWAGFSVFLVGSVYMLDLAKMHHRCCLCTPALMSTSLPNLNCPPFPWHYSASPGMSVVTAKVNSLEMELAMCRDCFQSKCSNCQEIRKRKERALSQSPKSNFTNTNSFQGVGCC